MSEKSSLRHFSDRRRQHRRENLAPRAETVSNAANVRRVWLSGRTSVLPATVARLSAVGKSFEMSRARLLGAILDWFAVQPQLIQAAVVGYPMRQLRADFSEMVLHRLLDR